MSTRLGKFLEKIGGWACSARPPPYFLGVNLRTLPSRNKKLREQVDMPDHNEVGDGRGVTYKILSGKRFAVTVERFASALSTVV
jgi:hypothetical protein